MASADLNSDIGCHRLHQRRSPCSPSYHDMLIKLHRILIAAQYRADPTLEPTPEQIQTIRVAWADAAA